MIRFFYRIVYIDRSVLVSIMFLEFEVIVTIYKYLHHFMLQEFNQGEFEHCLQSLVYIGHWIERGGILLSEFFFIYFYDYYV